MAVMFSVLLRVAAERLFEYTVKVLSVMLRVAAEQPGTFVFYVLCAVGILSWWLLGLVYILYSLGLHLHHYVQHGLGDSLAVPFFFAISSFAACACAAAACACARQRISTYFPDHVLLPRICATACFRTCILWAFLACGLFWGTLAISTGISFSLQCMCLFDCADGDYEKMNQASKNWVEMLVGSMAVVAMMCFCSISACGVVIACSDEDVAQTPSPEAASETSANVTSEGREECPDDPHDNPTVYGRSQLRDWLAGKQWKAFLFTGFPQPCIALQWCKSKLYMGEPEVVDRPSEDAEVMPNLVYVMADHVPEFNQRKQAPLRGEALEGMQCWKATQGVQPAAYPSS